MTLVSQVCFEFCSAASEVMLPLSKSGSMQASWLGFKFESGLESDITGASSSTSEGSGLFRGERTDSDGGRMAWGCEPRVSLLLRVMLRFWSTPKFLSPGEDPVRLFRGSGSWTEPTSWFKFLSKKWLVTSRETVRRESNYASYVCEWVYVEPKDQNVMKSSTITDPGFAQIE